MSRARLAVLALGGLSLVVAAGYGATALERLHIGAPIQKTGALVAQGKRLFAASCWHCHRDVDLGPRVRGWSAARAYEALGRLPDLSNGAMPPFGGSDAERRALAAYVAALGADEAELPPR